LARDRTFFIGFSSRLVDERVMISSGPRIGPEEASMEGEVAWLFTKGRKMDSSIKSWMRLTAESNVSGTGGAVTFEYWRRSSRTSLERLISRGDPGNIYAVIKRCQSMHKC
jgi:hypothetical protein